MASPKRHWPSMFKSKPCNAHHQCHHHINQSSLVPTGCHRSSYASVYKCEERSPEPKPRWNPRPEQIRILEAIFNSGMVNPPRDEIRRIRAQLQEYGQVGDANVFYWFQNRKSRSKHKLRLLQNSSNQHHHHKDPPVTASVSSLLAPSPSSSSSSVSKSSPKRSKTISLSSQSAAINVPTSPTGSVNQTNYQLIPEPYFCPFQQTPTGPEDVSFTQGYWFSELSNVVQRNIAIGPCTSLLLREMSCETPKNEDHHGDKSMKTQSQHCYSSTAPFTHSNLRLPPSLPVLTTDNFGVKVPSSVNQINQGVGESNGGAGRSTVHTNEFAYEVGMGQFNAGETFGSDLVLINSSGEPALTNDGGGLTLHSHHLGDGASYHLI